MSKGARTVIARTVTGLCISAGVAAYVWHISVRTPAFELFVFDTPGAPSLFIRTKDDRRILVHGGANSDVVRRVTELLPFYSRRIDTLVALDDDPKHVTGLIEMVGRYDIRSVLLGTATSTDPTYAVFLQRIAERGIATSSIRTGDIIAATPLRVFDMKKSVFTVVAGGKTTLVIPFNPNTLSKKLFEAANPDYLVYSAALTSKPSPKSTKSSKSDLFAGIMADQRFNIRESGAVRIWMNGNATNNKKAPSGASLNIERY